MHILEHLFLVGEFPERARLLSGLTLEQVTVRPDGASHSIYDELWHLVGYQQRIIEPGTAPAGEFYPSAAPEHEHQWNDLVRVFMNGARAAAALGEAPERLAAEVEPGVTLADELNSVAVHNAYHFGRLWPYGSGSRPGHPRHPRPRAPWADERSRIVRLSCLLRVCAVALIFGCSVASAPSTEPGVDAIEGHRARAEQFSAAIVRASASGWGDAEVAALTDFYTTEAVLFPPRREAIRGRDAVKRYWSRTPDRKILAHSIRTERADISGDLAADHGTFSLIAQSGADAPQHVTCNFVSIWRRGSDGLWRKQLDTWW